MMYLIKSKVMNKSKKTSVIKKVFFVPFLFLTLATATFSCSTTAIEEEVGQDEIEEGSNTYLIGKDEVTPPADRG